MGEVGVREGDTVLFACSALERRWLLTSRARLPQCVADKDTWGPSEAVLPPPGAGRSQAGGTEGGGWGEKKRKRQTNQGADSLL